MAGKRYLILVLLLAGLFIEPLSATTPQYTQARIIMDSIPQIFKLQKLHLDIVKEGRGYVEIITNPAELNELQTLGFKIEIIHEDLTEFYTARLAGRLPDTYKNFSQLESELFFMNVEHPDIVAPRVSIGMTLESRNIWAIKISDNPEIDEDEPEILYTAAIHAREVITPEVLLYFMNYLTDNYGTDPVATDLVDSRELWFIIVINPDGYSYNFDYPSSGGMWRKNRRNNGDGSYGVDLNRNFGYMWGYDDIGSSPAGNDETYRGTGPFSEAESQAYRDFVLAHDFSMIMNYHSYSNLILWPYGYEMWTYTPDDNVFSAIGDSISIFNGYTPEISSLLYTVNGDTDDWGYGEQTTKSKIFAMTIEAGGDDDGFWPPAERILPLVSENLQGNIFLGQLAGNVYSIVPPMAPTMIAADSVGQEIPYNVDWLLHDTLNPAVNYELVEMQRPRVVIDSAYDFDNWTNEGFVAGSAGHSGGTSFYSGDASVKIRQITSSAPYTVQLHDTLKFWTKYSIQEGWDFAYVEVSTDGAAFTTLAGNITTNDDPYEHNRGNGITGDSYGWVEGRFDLSAYAGQSIYVRFYYRDFSLIYAYWGIYIDDIRPIISFDTVKVLSSSIADTTYTISSRPAGYYYYKARGEDDEDQWGEYSAIKKVAVGVSASFVCGDADSDGLINLLDILYLISYKFKGGSEPVPLYAADVNADTHVDLLDILYLISYKFKGGDAPACNWPSGPYKIK
jgi:hypothetical protein